MTQNQSELTKFSDYSDLPMEVDKDPLIEAEAIGKIINGVKLVNWYTNTRGFEELKNGVFYEETEYTLNEINEAIRESGEIHGAVEREWPFVKKELTIMYSEYSDGDRLPTRVAHFRCHWMGRGIYHEYELCHVSFWADL